MEIALKKGQEEEKAILPDPSHVVTLIPKDLPAHPDEEKVLAHALQHPIGSAALSDLIPPGETTAIIISDISRPCPSWKILPLLIDRLHQSGISDKDLAIYIALGSHRHSSKEEKRHLVGEEVYERIACFDSNPDDTLTVGTTSRGTIVQVDRRVAKAKHRICIGNVEYHYFAGFSGGAKALFPGVSTPASIAMNHSHMTEPGACTGKLDGNPVREDIEEAGRMIGCDFLINVVLNPMKQIVYAVCGDLIKAHRDACRYLDSHYRCPIKSRADVVLVSQGGSPKDLNLYQMQKALDNAKYAVRDGGTIILVGSGREGFGNAVFEEWMLKYHTAEEMVQALHAHFVLGGHKACAIAQVSEHAEIDLVSDFSREIISKTLLKPYDSLQSAVDHALEKYGENASIIVMPYGGSTLPQVTSS